jgi:hypothetical protein
MKSLPRKLPRDLLAFNQHAIDPSHGRRFARSHGFAAIEGSQ